MCVQNGKKTFIMRTMTHIGDEQNGIGFRIWYNEPCPGKATETHLKNSRMKNNRNFSYHF